MILTMLWNWLRGFWSGSGEPAPMLEARMAAVGEAELVDSSNDRDDGSIVICGDAPTEPPTRP